MWECFNSHIPFSYDFQWKKEMFKRSSDDRRMTTTRDVRTSSYVVDDVTTTCDVRATSRTTMCDVRTPPCERRATRRRRTTTCDVLRRRSTTRDVRTSSCYDVRRCPKVSSLVLLLGLHSHRGELKSPLSWATFRQSARRGEFGRTCGRGGLGVRSLLGIPGSALRA